MASDAPLPFPVDVLPTRLRRFVSEVAADLACPPDFAAAPMLAVAAGAAGNSFALQLSPTWKEFPCLWLTVFGGPGSGKRVASRWVCDPLIQREMAPQKPRCIFKPVPSFSSLAHRLTRNPQGFLLTEEVGCWWKMMRRRSRERSLFLQLWSGQPMCVPCRSGVISLPAASVSVLLTLRPAALRTRSSRTPPREDFLGRMLFAFPKRLPTQWTWDAVSSKARRTWRRTLRAVLSMRARAEETEATVLLLTPDAVRTWDDCRTGNEMPGLWPVHLARLALVVHLLRCACKEAPNSGAVDAESIERAGQLVRYFQSHAANVQAALAQPEEVC
jgi:Protein of unknown function (DUF3987)